MLWHKIRLQNEAGPQIHQSLVFMKIVIAARLEVEGRRLEANSHLGERGWYSGFLCSSEYGKEGN